MQTASLSWGFKIYCSAGFPQWHGLESLEMSGKLIRETSGNLFFPQMLESCLKSLFSAQSYFSTWKLGCVDFLFEIQSVPLKAIIWKKKITISKWFAYLHAHWKRHNIKSLEIWTTSFSKTQQNIYRWSKQMRINTFLILKNWSIN